MACLALSLLCVCGSAGCGGNSVPTSQAAALAAPPPAAPPADSTGGFDGQQAFRYVSDFVAIGPHPAGSEGDKRAQQYIIGKLKSFGCPVDEEDFTTPSPIGTVAMKNIIAKVPGTSPDIVMFATHYDTKKLDGFVGANDGGSSTGLTLELANLVCKRKNALTIWLTFFDGEEAFNFDWKDPDNTYGSRELAARMALSGDLPHLKAMILTDMIGGRGLQLLRESDSTPWLTDMVWSTAAKLGYGDVFVNQKSEVDDDHDAFLKRGVAAVDIIDLAGPIRGGYWHTLDDTLDKVSPPNLALVGHVLIATVPQLEQKFAAR
jgi:glutaminyl-peptide cyclotransferase